MKRLLAGGCGLALMILPTLIVGSELLIFWGVGAGVGLWVFAIGMGSFGDWWMRTMGQGMCP